MVICSHAFVSNYETGGFFVRSVGQLFHYGLFGVDLFFVLSGFLITGILFDSLGDPGFFRKFYARRALRIFPLYYGVLLVLFVLTHSLHLHWGHMGWLLLAYLQNLRPAEINNFSLPGLRIGLYHFWSLAVEEQFYFVWPAVIFFVRGKRSLLLIMLTASAGALFLRLGLLAGGVSAIAIHVTTLCRADSLLLGGVLAMLYRSRHWPRVLQVAPWGFFGAAAVIVASIVLLEPRAALHPLLDRFWVSGLRYSVLALGFPCLIAWSLRPKSLFQWIFQLSWLRFFGKYSYGIYVLHVLALSLFVLPLRAAFLQTTHSKLLAVAGAGIVSLTIGVLAAYVSFHLYEKPFLRLKHLFDYSRPSLNHSSAEEAMAGR